MQIERKCSCFVQILVSFLRNSIIKFCFMNRMLGAIDGKQDNMVFSYPVSVYGNWTYLYVWWYTSPHFLSGTYSLGKCHRTMMLSSYLQTILSYIHLHEVSLSTNRSKAETSTANLSYRLISVIKARSYMYSGTHHCSYFIHLQILCQYEPFSWKAE